MAGTSLFVLLDDIASVLDDVATMTKVATKKTAGVLGDDLALNAQQVAGVRTERELPVVWAVAKGSMLNKLILVPAALAIAAFLPWAIVPLLMLGGAYLCYEGVEKLVHHFLHRAEDKAHRQEVLEAMANGMYTLTSRVSTRLTSSHPSTSTCLFNVYCLLHLLVLFLSFLIRNILIYYFYSSYSEPCPVCHLRDSAGFLRCCYYRHRADDSNWLHMHLVLLRRSKTASSADSTAGIGNYYFDHSV